MKLQSLFALTLALFVFACNSAPEGTQVEAGEAEEINTEAATGAEVMVNTEASMISWVGTKPLGDRHEGTIMIKSGKLMHDGSTITGGEFVIDMNSIANTDIPDAEYRANLEGHLKSGDFFEVEKHPEAKFTIASVAPTTSDSTANYVITGNLMMKDSTKSIQIPAMISMDNGTVKAMTPSFTIDRTEWGVMFLSGALGTVKDKMINDQIGLQINLVADAAPAAEEATEEVQ